MEAKIKKNKKNKKKKKKKKESPSINSSEFRMNLKVVRIV